MGKKPAAGGGKGGRTNSLDRAARVAHGRAVLQKVQVRVEELEVRSVTGLPNQGKRATDRTRKKYRDEEITQYAYDKSIDDKELRAWVDLAEVADLVDGIQDAHLKEEFNTGRLMLTKSDLPELLGLADTDDLDKWLRSRLKEQV